MKETVVRNIHLFSYRWHALLAVSRPFTAAEKGLELALGVFSFRQDSHRSLSVSSIVAVAGSREQSYVYALAAAALTQSIAKACSSGASAKCSCGPLPNEPPPGEFKWGGCGDDVGFGIIFSKWFTDTPWNRRRTSKRHLVNIHNNAVGRQVYF